MNNHNYDSFSTLKFRKRYQLNNLPETIVVIETEYVETPTDTETSTEISGKEIIFVLGVIATFTVLSFVQLYRSLEVTPVNPEVTQSNVLSTSYFNL